MNNPDRFLGKVADYQRYRERYDPALILPLLRAWCGLTQAWRIADIGAGTGMLADVFLHNGNHVVAVGPNAEMREACQALHRDTTALHTIAGTAEATTLPAHSLEMVAVGRALHWFHLPGALAEFRRILVPGGWLTAIVFGRTEDGSPANEALEHLLRTVTHEGRSSHTGYAVYRELESACIPGANHQQQTFHTQHLSWQQFSGMVQSLSHAPLQQDPRHQAFMNRLRKLFEDHAIGGLFPFATRTWIAAGRLSEKIAHGQDWEA